MEYRRMGRSGLQLSVLSFGSWVTFHKQIADNSADELMMTTEMGCFMRVRDCGRFVAQRKQ